MNRNILLVIMLVFAFTSCKKNGDDKKCYITEYYTNDQLIEKYEYVGTKMSKLIFYEEDGSEGGYAIFNYNGEQLQSTNWYYLNQKSSRSYSDISIVNYPELRKLKSADNSFDYIEIVYFFDGDKISRQIYYEVYSNGAKVDYAYDNYEYKDGKLYKVYNYFLDELKSYSMLEYEGNEISKIHYLIPDLFHSGNYQLKRTIFVDYDSKKNIFFGLNQDIPLSSFEYTLDHNPKNLEYVFYEPNYSYSFERVYNYVYNDYGYPESRSFTYSDNQTNTSVFLQFAQ